MEVPSVRLSVAQDRLAEVIHRVFGVNSTTDGLHASVVKLNRPDTRAARLQEVQRQIEDVMSEVESLHDEMQEWYDNMPENLQDGDKGNAVQECADQLENIKDQMQTALDEMDGVDFPSAY